eukprot:SAG11_NODE_890_length_6689_cov_18.947951_7_plen_67_part_00
MQVKCEAAGRCGVVFAGRCVKGRKCSSVRKNTMAGAVCFLQKLEMREDAMPGEERGDKQGGEGCRQ